MPRRIYQWSACGAIMALLWTAGATARGQQLSPQPPIDPVQQIAAHHVGSPYVTASTGGSYLVTSNRPYAEEAGLADRVAALEEANQKLADKVAEDKKKAAGKPSVTVGGRIFADWTAFDQNPASIGQIGDQQNGFRFDTAQIFVAGSAFEVMEYKIQYDFAGTQSTAAGDTLQAATWKDVYLGITQLPYIGAVRIGHYKEPFSMEQLESSRFTTFMERSLADAFVPARNVGIMAHDHSENERMTWALGAFIGEIGDEPPIFENDSGGTAVTGRVTYLPWYDEATEGRGLFHTGLAYSYRDIADDTVRFRSQPEAGLASYIVDSGTIGLVSDLQLVGAEAAFVYGPFSVQSEYIYADVDRMGAGSLDFSGVYVYTSYFLTGESRGYKRSSGTFDRVHPFENFFRVRTEDGDIHTGKGAWEVAYRYSYVDLNDGAIAGGNATDHTFGLNWYLNPYTRLMFNYVNSDLRRGGTTGNMNIFETRAQIDF